MMRRTLLTALLATVAATQGFAQQQADALPDTGFANQVDTALAALPSATPAAPPARLPGFAAELADRPGITGPDGWRAMPLADALAGLARARGVGRQAARWRYALALMAEQRPQEASGVLDVMLQDDPDLALAENFQLVRGAVLTTLVRSDEALPVLNHAGLATNPEACLWRMRALAQAGAHQQALAQAGCAPSALQARNARERLPFLLPAADSAIAVGRAEMALTWLRSVPSGDAGANLRRGKAHLELNQTQPARLALTRAERGGTPGERVDARVTLIEAQVAQRTMPPLAALRELERIRYRWRGGEAEERALRLSYRLARSLNQPRSALSAGATLVRHFALGSELPPLMADVQATLAALLAPDNRMPIDQAAGLYWEYRDLAPVGSEGDRLVTRLADRLAALGLYARAAELLEHQLLTRARDLAQGPLSVRVAKLHILAGHPARAVEAMRATGRTLFPQSMLHDRQRITAVALHQLGRGREALAVLQDVSAAEGLRAELYWKQRDWANVARVSEAEIGGAAPGRLSALRQAVVLRYAIALGMIGREAELQNLRLRFEVAFDGLPTARAFDLLTRDPTSIDAESLAQAMAAIPAVSPAGELADLLELAPAPRA